MWFPQFVRPSFRAGDSVRVSTCERGVSRGFGSGVVMRHRFALSMPVDDALFTGDTDTDCQGCVRRFSVTERARPVSKRNAHFYREVSSILPDRIPSFSTVAFAT